MALELVIPGSGKLSLEHLVLDYNGTIADRGQILPGVAERLRKLCTMMTVHVITADTFGTVRAEVAALFPDEQRSGRLVVDILPPRESRPGRNEGEAKLDMLEGLGAGQCCAMGNGRNDVLMLKAAGLSFAVMGREGACAQAFMSADAAVTNILDALDLLLEPQCCTATLRI